MSLNSEFSICSLIECSLNDIQNDFYIVESDEIDVIEDNDIEYNHIDFDQIFDESNQYIENDSSF